MGRSRRNSVSLVLCRMCVVLFAGVFLVSGRVNAQISLSSGSLAPTNPAYEKYIAKKASTPVTAMPKTASGHYLGYIPPRFKVPALKGPSKTALGTVQATTPAPSYYDLRVASTVAPKHPVGVTPVKDQYGCGDCWAFATMASLESYLKLHSVTASFSEEDLNENHGWDYAPCMGGNEWMATAYMARWAGPVNEIDVPVPYWFTEQGEGGSPAPSQGLAIPELSTLAPVVGATPGAATKYHIQNVYWLPQGTYPMSSADIITAKQAIMNNGAVAVSFYYDDSYYNTSTFSYYCNDSTQVPNHEVAIVGWDDNYSSANFSTPPAGRGAFIVKNSWGTGWGQSGYFYMSYYGTTLSLDAQFYAPQPATNYTRIYQYDPLGPLTFYDFSGSYAETQYYANVFMASANAAHIKGVGLYAPVANTEYTIWVFSNLPNGGSPSTMGFASGTLVQYVSGTLQNPGYNTIPLKSTAVTPNAPFSVVVEVTTPGFGYPVPVEYSEAPITAGGACPGMSYVSGDGSTWAYGDDFKVSLKAYATR